MNPSNRRESPFHRGEQKIQSRLGVREQMEKFGQQMILDYLPTQHRDFYQQLSFVLVGHADKQGKPWASILFKQHQLMQSPHRESLHINTLPVEGDPLQNSLSAGLRLGLLGIELNTRRRNRVSAHIESVSSVGLQLKVDQAFGNCPQYIRPRQLKWLGPEVGKPALVKKICRLDQSAVNLIATSDTFFVASSLAKDGKHASDGADVSHRGGEAGFLRVDDETSLTIPDYSGNMHFNTLGNFIENPKAGMLFVDFEQGRLLTLTGSVEVVWQSDDIANFEGAQRLWRFKLEQGFWLENSLPIR